ncbi:MAG: hypothetical protein LRY50_11610 [Geovibrio sp.]|nr:hypothetical protein [Geovibrio sp.]
MAQAGTIKSLSGTVTARSADGQVRTLAVGDIVLITKLSKQASAGQ